MSKSKSLKIGSILSETSFFKVEGFQPNGNVIVSDDRGNKGLEIGLKYVDNVLEVADYYTSEEQKSMTELAEFFISSSRIAMTVCFTKKAKPKTKKVLDAEKAAKVAQFERANLREIEALVNDLIENPITKEIPGELRVMKGRHYGNVDELGRVHFIDMEITKDEGKDYDNRMRQVDPRTIQYLIVGGVKYILKK
jgi:hypothetical protein